MLDVSEIVMVDPRELDTAPPFSTVFAVKPDVQEKIVESMTSVGYDPTKPVAVWRERNVVIDGHTRILSAIKARIFDIPVAFFSFASEDDALLYAITSQVHRRNLSQSELLTAVKAVDKIKARGGDRKSEKSKTSAEVFDRGECSANETAKILGVGRATVERARVVLKDEEASQSVLDGKASIRMAADRVRAKKAKPTQQTEKPAQQSALFAESTTTAALASAPPLPKFDAAPASAPFTATEKPRWDTQQYRMDVRIYHELKPLYDQLRDRLKEITGLNGSEVYGPAYQKTRAVALMAHPRDWVDCTRCKGTGKKNGVPCEACKMGRYKIPNL